MRFAFCNEGFGDKPWHFVCRAHSQAGYDGVEIAPYTFGEDVRLIGGRQRAEIKRGAHDAGLRIVGRHWLLVKPAGLHIAYPDRSVREATRDDLRSLAEFCAEWAGRSWSSARPGSAGAPPAPPPSRPGSGEGDLPRRAPDPRRLRGHPLHGAAGAGPRRPPEACRLPQHGGRRRGASSRRSTTRAFRLLLDVLSLCSEDRPIPEIIREQADLLAHFHANDKNDQAPGLGRWTSTPSSTRCARWPTAGTSRSSRSGSRRRPRSSPGRPCGISRSAWREPPMNADERRSALDETTLADHLSADELRRAALRVRRVVREF